MRGTLIRGGRIIDPANGVDRIDDLFIAEGRIAGVGEAPAGFLPEQVLEAAGKIVCPGLVDLAARLREPGQTQKASIASETRAAAAGGITTVCALPDTSPAIDTPAVVELIRNRADAAQGARVLPYGALTRNLEGELLSEMASLREAGCAAMSDGGRPLENARVLRRALEYADTFGLPVFLTPKEPRLAEGGLMHEGAVSTRMGLPGVPAAAETAALARDLALVEQTGTRCHFGRLSTARAVELIARALRDGLPVSADVAIHQLFLTEMDVWDYDSACRVDPPLRGDYDRDALRAAVASGVIAAVCSDHQPHDADAKAANFAATEPGISGLDSLLALVLRLVDEDLLPLSEALARVTCNPARILGIEAGTLSVGAPADVCVFDPDEVWWYRPESMLSRGKNSPFIGWEFTGRVTHTLVGGRLVHSRGA